VKRCGKSTPVFW